MDHGQSGSDEHGVAQLTHMTSSNSKACEVKSGLLHIAHFMNSCAELLCADRAVDRRGQLLLRAAMLVESPSDSA